MEDSINNKNNECELIYITKKVIISDELPTFELDFYQWKKNYWKENIKNIKNIVAPMVDQSELAFRMLLRKYGAHLCFTPMIHANLFVNDFTYRKNAFSTIPEDRPLIIQFCANNSELFLKACRLVEGFCDGVDLNLGCPQLIAKKGRYGAFLEDYPELVCSMVSSVYKHCRLPISVKIRIREDYNTTLKFAKMLEEAGASLLTVHGRTREQKGVNTGMADWTQISKLKKDLKIPIIANGNIQLINDVEKCIEITGADAVMSAEGILSNPLLFSGNNLCSFYVAHEYLNFAEKYKASVSSIRAHLFKICHYSLLRQRDLREKNSCVFTIDDFRQTINELEHRCLIEQFNGKNINYLTSSELFKSNKQINKNFNLLDLSNKLPLKLEPSTHLILKEIGCYSLSEVVNSTPYWICKPYFRLTKDNSNYLEDIKINSNSDNLLLNTNKDDYRAQRKAEMKRICDETGLSRRQIRKRERRRIEAQRKDIIKQSYPKCSNCQQPSSKNCRNISCKRCCYLTCVRFDLNCKTHGFDHLKITEKRANTAKQLGITIEELLIKEINELEHRKFLKNGKKFNFNLTFNPNQ